MSVSLCFLVCLSVCLCLSLFLGLFVCLCLSICLSVQALNESLQEEEGKVVGLIELGNVLLTSVGKETAAEAEIDKTLSDSETRWLVSE